MQNGAGEPGGLDRILPAAADERLADEHHACQAIEQPQFADRVADIDRRPGPDRVAARAQGADEALRLELAQDRLAPIGMARRDQRQRVGKHLAEAPVRRRRDHLLAFVGRGGDPDLAARRQAGELGQLAPVGRQRRRVEFDVAGDEHPRRAQRNKPFAVALAAGEAQIEILHQRGDEPRRLHPATERPLADPPVDHRQRRP